MIHEPRRFPTKKGLDSAVVHRIKPNFRRIDSYGVTKYRNDGSPELLNARPSVRPKRVEPPNAGI